jgi:hypothetical protein
MNIYLFLCAAYFLFQATLHSRTQLVAAVCYLIMSAWSIVFFVQ